MPPPESEREWFTSPACFAITLAVNGSSQSACRLRRRFLSSCGLALAAFALALFLPGCAVGPNYRPPEVTSPGVYQQAVTNNFTTNAVRLQQWWTNFNDPRLESLIQRASTNNLDLKIAAARIQEARALRGVAKSGLVPQVDGTGNAQLTRLNEDTPGLQDPDGWSASVGAAAAWELDVWGRVRRGIESATAGYQSTVEDFRDTLVILYAEIGLSYVQVRTLQNRIKYAEDNVLTQKETLQLTEDLNEAGLVGNLDVSQATLNLESTRSAIPTLRAQLTQTINRLGVLLGEPPETLHAELGEVESIPVPPDIINAGLPADLLRQRPDIRSAERNLAAQTALIGVAAAELYPQFFLPGTLSLEALDIGNLSGSSVTYAFGPTMRWTLFSGGRVRNTIKVEEARTEQVLNAYEQSILLALEEAEGAMVAFAQEQDRRGSVLAARNAAAQSVELVKDQYRSGLTQFQNVLDMERSLAQRDDDLAVSRGLLAGNAVRIYRALGGGWDPDDPEPWSALEAARNPSTQ